VDCNKVKEEYKSCFSNRTKERFNDRFKERFEQYVLNYKGDDSEDLEDFNKIFKTLIIDIGSKLNYEKELELSTTHLTTTTYLTAFGELTPSEATSMSVVLANKAFSYSLTLEDTTKPTLATNPMLATNPILATNPTLATNPFTYTLNTSSS
jgi:hypothetical protein